MPGAFSSGVRAFVPYACLFVMVGLTLFGQIVIKWQVSKLGGMPAGLAERVGVFAGLLLNPWVLGAFAAAFLASFFWMAALTRLPLNVAYPFTTLTLVGVLLASALVFHEPLAASKWIGMLLLIAGVLVSSQRW